MDDVTRILSAVEQGDPHAAEQLLPLVYDELRKLAAQRMAQEAPGQTLQATALVHEAYLRLVGRPSTARTGTAAATSSPPPPRPCAASSSSTPAASGRSKHGGGRQRGRPGRRRPRRRRPTPDDLLALDEALTDLAASDPAAAELVKLRYFAGLTVDEAADGPRHLAPRPPTGTGPTPGPGCYASSAADDRPTAAADSDKFFSGRCELGRRFRIGSCTASHRTGRCHERSIVERATRSSSPPWSIDDPAERAGLPGRGLRRRRRPARRASRHCSRAHEPAGSFLEQPAAAATGPSRRRRPPRRPGTVDRPVQAAGADRRRRHGPGLHGRADSSRSAARSR